MQQPYPEITKYLNVNTKPHFMEHININLGNCTMTMVHIPGNGELSGFYVSETPITIQQYKSLYPKNEPDIDSWFEYYERQGSREYDGFTVATAFTVENVLDFLNKIRQPVFYCLPSREQWLHLVNNHYDKIKWCVDEKFCGTSEYKAIAWEMMRDNSFGIYCLLGIEYNEIGERVILGNNFRKSQERDNIAFRLVCSEFEINSYYK